MTSSLTNDMQFLGYLYHQAPGVLLLVDGNENTVSEILELSRTETAQGVLTVNLKLPPVTLPS
jgi:hypothetical protein